MLHRSVALFVLWIAACVTAFGQSYKFTAINYPGATSTSPTDINQHGMIVGSYLDADSNVHGFAYFNGSFAAIDVPDALLTSANGINNKGIIVGHFSVPTGTHGYVLRDGRFTQIDFPGSTYTDVEGINDANVLTGSYIDASGNLHSFLRLRSGRFRTVDFPGADYTAVNGINNNRELTGQTSPPFISAFLFSGGQWTSFYFPDAFTSTGRGINSLGQIVGVFNPQDPEAPIHGFLRDAEGTFQQIDFPGSSGSTASGINDDGVIVGDYNDAAGVTHGYIARPSKPLSLSIVK